MVMDSRPLERLYYAYYLLGALVGWTVAYYLAKAPQRLTPDLSR